MRAPAWAGTATLKLKLSRKLERTKRIRVLVAGTAVDAAGGKSAARCCCAVSPSVQARLAPLQG